MKRFQGQIEHNRETITLLFKVAYDTFEMKRILIRLTIGVIMVILGLFGELNQVIQGILLMTGAWLIVSRDFPPKVRADRTLEERKQPLPILVSTFYEDRMELSGEGRMSLRYRDFQHIVEENDYFFLFLHKNSACMIDSKTLEPDSLEEFKDFVSRKTNLQWQKNTSWFNMSLKELLQLLKQ
ncbi:YcxB family protein [Alloiococcus sp. CFN-8]|uniref:YcxB family protein n=1 Tax=Alloiococcus sp. CFN-8 TaxID=3416081 RepID=UPI003CEDE627